MKIQQYVRTYKGSFEQIEVEINKHLKEVNNHGVRIVSSSIAGTNPDTLVALVTYEHLHVD